MASAAVAGWSMNISEGKAVLGQGLGYFFYISYWCDNGDIVVDDIDVVRMFS